MCAADECFEKGLIPLNPDTETVVALIDRVSPTAAFFYPRCPCAASPGVTLILELCDVGVRRLALTLALLCPALSIGDDVAARLADRADAVHEHPLPPACCYRPRDSAHLLPGHLRSCAQHAIFGTDRAHRAARRCSSVAISPSA